MSFAVPQLNLHSGPQPNTGCMFLLNQETHLASDGYPEPQLSCSVSPSPSSPFAASPAALASYKTSRAASRVTLAQTLAALTQGYKLSAFLATVILVVGKTLASLAW
ncbi:hypothetical protein PC116_g30905 [Phytophthora cactorum]|nr:hypothetical protein PC116_g30905 [Phytophthora cactorum]